MKQKRELVMVLLLVALVAVAGAQTYQLAELKDDIAQGAVVSADAPTQPSQSAVQRLQDLPQMVGGC